MASEYFEDLKEKFKVVQCEHKTLKNFDFEKFPHCKFKEFHNAKKCAVLLLLFKSKYISNNELCLLFTIRSENLRSFPGEICYPGGKFDKKHDKSYIDTALREASEEIGLRRENVRVICQLCPCLSPLGHYIVPVVGLLENLNFADSWEILKSLKCNTNEVSLIFWIPLKYFSEAIRSNEFFNQHINELELSKLNLDRNKEIPRFIVRNIFEINVGYLNNELNKLDEIVATNTLIYGINSQLAIFLTLICIEESQFECKIRGIINRNNILNYLNYTTLGSYLLFKINRLDRAKSMKAKL